MTSKLKIALIGHGHLGKWHGEKIEQSSLAELSYIVESNTQNHDEIQKKYPQTKIVNELSAVFGKVDAGIVVTPTHIHFEIVKELVKNNIHVFCEKPLVSTVEQGENLKVLMKDKNLKLQVGHSERFHEIWKNSELLNQFLTEDCFIRINRGAPFKGRATDVDVVQDLMIHDLDLLFYLLGEEPNELHSYGKKVITDKWDVVHSELSFPSGRHCQLMVSRAHVFEDRSVVIQNNNGTLKINLMNQEVSWIIGQGEVQSLTYQKNDHLKLEQDAFFNSITNDLPTVVDLEAGLLAVEYINKVISQLESNG